MGNLLSQPILFKAFSQFIFRLFIIDICALFVKIWGYAYLECPLLWVLHRFPPCPQYRLLRRRQSPHFVLEPSASGQPVSCICRRYNKPACSITVLLRQRAPFFHIKIVRTAIHPVISRFLAIQGENASGSAVRIFCGNRLRGYSQFSHKTGGHRCGKRLTPTECTHIPAQRPIAPPLQTAAGPHPDRGSPHR